MSILALVLLLFVLWDAFVTVFSTNGAGPLTTLWTQGIWRGLLVIHHRRPIHRVLAVTGPAMLVMVILAWYLLIGLGWLLLFSTAAETVVVSSTRAPTDIWQKAYFVGATISSLGYGDLVPSAFPWTLCANIAALSATVVLTTALSYVLAVLSAAIERKMLAEGIFAVGSNVSEFVDRAWGRHSQGELNNHLLRLSSDIDAHAHKYLSYPILEFFHSSNPCKSPIRAVLTFSDALFLVTHGVAPELRPPRSILQVVDSSISNYAELTSSGWLRTGQIDEPVPDKLTRQTLRDIGLDTVSEAEFQAALEDYLPRRNQLLALCRNDGWC